MLIGQNMDQKGITKMLDHCLLTEAELATDEKNWQVDFPDPFPVWPTQLNTLE